MKLCKTLAEDKNYNFEKLPRKTGEHSAGINKNIFFNIHGKI